MTDDTCSGELVSIGELSARTGLTVRTIRFYCDEGLLEARRSPGGHRMFDAGRAVDRLALIRRLRALGLGLDSITEVLHGQLSLAEAVAVESARLDVEFRSLAWRRASLRAVGTAAPVHRAERLALLAAAQDGGAVYDGIVQFWRRVLAPVARHRIAEWVCGNVPEPPHDPTAEQVVAFAELATLVADPAMTSTARQHYWRHQPETITHRQRLFDEVGELVMDVVPLITAGVAAHTGTELDRFVRAHATARGESDSPGFRRQLWIAARDPGRRVDRYWALTDQLNRSQLTVEAVHRWLLDSLSLHESGAAPDLDCAHPDNVGTCR
ncbi:MerR family transcriptional regulator [Nocardia stercoris]|uniref:MerR family transcriptional regulator n=1 Tax=Nocardia stercoris TaxID=2483361 RepID=UPI0018F6509F|nr:MerR family transcriptional regulator [Nocardia stercoris]